MSKFDAIPRPEQYHGGRKKGFRSALTMALLATETNGGAIRIALDGMPPRRVRTRLWQSGTQYGRSVHTQIDGDAVVAWVTGPRPERVK
jgi:hypothetical protein